MFGVLLSSSRFLIVLACLILSVLSTIDQYQALAHTTLFWVVSLQPSERRLALSNHTRSHTIERNISIVKVVKDGKSNGPDFKICYQETACPDF